MRWFYLIASFALCTTPLHAAKRVETPPVSCINIVDRNGMSETISGRDRLKKYEKVDFLQNQPYKKVTRVLERDSKGNVRAFITSYHANGQLKQYLEVVNGRAFGTYQERFPNGQLKLDAVVIGGMADIKQGAEKSWLFDGMAEAWDESGNLVAEIPYNKGELEGTAVHYHANGNIWKKIPYSHNGIDGVAEIYLKDGQLLQTTAYAQNVRHGDSVRYWPPNKIAAKETYTKGLLETGRYYDCSGQQIAEISEGNGFRPIFTKSGIKEIHEYRDGVPEGEVKVFNSDGKLLKLFHVKNNLKHGEEVEYFEKSLSRKPLPRLSVDWYQGKVQGLVKTWYTNGVMESQKEMSNNKKQGVYTAWYTDGSMMMMEEYDHDKIVRGDYFKKGDRAPISQVRNGKGLATLFDSEGHFTRKVDYLNGKPLK